MDWQNRSSGGKRLQDGGAVADKARREREARAALRAQQIPATQIQAVWRGSRARLRELARCALSVERKIEDIEKVKGFVGPAFKAPPSIAKPVLRELCFLTLRGFGTSLPKAGPLAERVLAGLFFVPEEPYFRRRLALVCWTAMVSDTAPAAKAAILELTADERTRADCSHLWEVELGLVMRSRGSNDLFEVGCARSRRSALFLRLVFAVPNLADRVQLAPYTALLAGLEGLLEEKFEDGTVEELNWPSWLLGNLERASGLLDLKDAGTALTYCRAVALLIAKSNCAEALFSDPEGASAVVGYRSSGVMQTPVVCPEALRSQAARLASGDRLEALAYALLPEADDDGLDFATAEDAKLDRELASLNADTLQETAARKLRRSMVSDVLGAKWARQLDDAGATISRGWSSLFSSSSKKQELPKSTPAPAPVRRKKASSKRELELAAGFAEYLLAVLSSSGPKRRENLLTSIAFSKLNLARRLWSVVYTTLRPLREALARFLTLREVEEHDDDRALAVVGVAFAAVLQHALVPVDDDELRASLRPLGVHQLRRVVASLKVGLFDWCVQDGEGPPLVVYAARAISGLLRDLQLRSVRRPFARPQLWVVEELKSLKPKLLRIAPYAVPFRVRARLFADTTGSIANAQAEQHSFEPTRNKTRVLIRRGREFEDAFSQLARLPAEALRGRLVVNFDGEVGIDAGGLFKELWTAVAATAFGESYGLFKTTRDGLLYPNPDSRFLHGDGDESLYKFVGRVLGKALREGITIQPRFARFFLSFLRGDYNYLSLLDDLATLDPELYKNLIFLRSYSEPADLGLTFSVDHERFGTHVTVDLVHRGSQMDVTAGNRHLYIQLLAKHHLVDRIERQSKAFVRGLSDAVDPKLLALFSEPELQLLVSGAETSLDVDDLREHSKSEGFMPGDKHASRFWNVVRTFTPQERAALLKFATSCERAPPLGFAQLQPPFTLRKVAISRDDERLPTASTCFNTLKLPTYSSEAVLKKKLLTSINSGAGFDLS